MVAKTRAPAQTTQPFPWKILILGAIGLLLARLAYLLALTPYGLGPDEAQYWHWSTQLSWSYLTKPPLTSWLIWLSTQVLGQTEIGVRAFALLGQTATLVIGSLLAWRLNPTRAAALWALGLLALAPATGFAGLVMSPDALLVPLYLSALLLLVIEAQRANAHRYRWLAIGLLVGLAGLAKYSAVFFFPLVGLYALCARRNWLLNPWLYGAGLIALALQTPVIYWNLQNSLEGLAHVLWQANAGDARHGGVGTLVNFILGQLGIFGPVVFGLMASAVAAAVGGWRRVPAAHRLMLVFIVPLFASFLLQNLVSKVQPNWPILATVPALILLAAWLPGQSLFIRRTALVGLTLNAVLVILLSHVVFFGFPQLLKPLREMLGVREAVHFTSLLLKKSPPNTILVSSNYGTTARQAFYARDYFGTPMANRVFYINPGHERPTHYDLSPPKLTGTTAIFVAMGNNTGLPEAVRNRFKSCALSGTGRIRHGDYTAQQTSYYFCAGGK